MRPAPGLARSLAVVLLWQRRKSVGLRLGAGLPWAVALAWAGTAVECPLVWSLWPSWGLLWLDFGVAVFSFFSIGLVGSRPPCPLRKASHPRFASELAGRKYQVSLPGVAAASCWLV